MTVLTRIEGVAPLGSELPVGLAPETNIRTPCGLRHIENIRPGDLVVTRSAGLQPVRMVWKRTVCAAEIAADPALAGVVLPARAIGPMMPQAPLRVAAGHGLLIPGYRIEGQSDDTPCLMRARDFAGICEDVSVEADGRKDAVYYNLVFDNHLIFMANGLPVESFLPTQTTIGALPQNEREALEHAAPALCRGEGDDLFQAYPVWDDNPRVAARA